MVERTAENVQILEKKPLYKGFFKADEYFLRYPRYDGTMSRTVSREVMERGHAAAVLLYDAEREKIVLVEQFRVGVYLTGENPWIAECVAGIIGQGETPEAVARREAVEESGCEVGEIIPICRYFSSPGGMSETLYVFAVRRILRNAPLRRGWKTKAKTPAFWCWTPTKRYRLF